MTSLGTIPTTPALLRSLRLGLLFSSVGWGISFFFTFAPWDLASEQLTLMGSKPIHYDPLLDYWLRMASAGFGGIGIASALACIRPRFFRGLIVLLGPFHLFVGAVLTVSALNNQLDPKFHPTFIADITFCFVTAILIIAPLFAACYYERRKVS